MTPTEVKQRLDLAHEIPNNFYAKLVALVIVLFFLTIIMGGITLLLPDYRFINLIAFFPGVFAILFFGFQPKLLSGASLFGWIFLGGFRLSGIVDGLTLQRNIVFTVAIVYTNIVYLNSLYPFNVKLHPEHIGVWLILHAAFLGLGLAGVMTGAGNTLYRFNYKLNLWLMIALTLWVFVQALGFSPIKNAFDAKSGEPLYMVDPNTGSRDALGRSPAECRPSGVPYEGFNYPRAGLCFSSESGSRLVPMSAEDALGRNPVNVITGVVTGAVDRLKSGDSTFSNPTGCSNGQTLKMGSTRTVTVKLCADGGPVKILRAGGRQFDFSRLNVYIEAPTGTSNPSGLCDLRVHRDVAHAVTSACAVPSHMAFGVDAFTIVLHPGNDMKARGYPFVTVVVREES